MRRAARLAIAVALVATARPLAAQRLAWDVSAGVGAMPDAFSARCGAGGRSSGGGFLLGVAGRWRLPPLVVLEADLSTGISTFAKGCDAVLRARATPLGDGRVAEREFVGYAVETRDPAFWAASLRAGVETPEGAPRRVPLLRATAGAGLVRNAAKPQLEPLVVLAGGVGTRGRGARVMLEGEWTYFRADARERLTVVRPATATTPRSVESTSEGAIRLPQGWTVARLRVEFPIGARRR
ncbi:hypothetical protein [Roseisolibacter agri]|uniref:Uncharacterized protein n=1 Tax=Roseisolibacter agri TaxID=2014610 RepID=A0AA37VD41_9BACT|nr:hypothetical protein [Roseisolibacter agri]GLC28423.1 hypothetical protein rosag_49360 [Roseisolibacter agri]